MPRPLYGFVNLPKGLESLDRKKLMILEPLLNQLKIRAWHKPSLSIQGDFYIILPSKSDKLQFPRIIGNYLSKLACIAVLHEIGHFLIAKGFDKLGRKHEHTYSLSHQAIYILEEELQAWKIALQLYRHYYRKNLRLDWSIISSYIIECLTSYATTPKKEKQSHSKRAKNLVGSPETMPKV